MYLEGVLLQHYYPNFATYGTSISITYITVHSWIYWDTQLLQELTNGQHGQKQRAITGNLLAGRLISLGTLYTINVVVNSLELNRCVTERDDVGQGLCSSQGMIPD